MDIDYLLSNAGRFAYEYSKFFNEDEKLLKYFKTKDSVVIISTRKLCVFYVGIIIDFKQEFLSKLVLQNIDENLNSFDVVLENKEFHIRFETNQEFQLFHHYYNKYKE